MIQEYLQNIVSRKNSERNFSLNLILENSLYYPCSLFDGTPFRNHLKLGIDSFVYVDWTPTAEDFSRQVNQLNAFRGYEIAYMKDISQGDLVSKGWKPQLPPDIDLKAWQFTQMMHVKSLPFCKWIILERQENFDDHHGFKYLSLLYLKSDFVAAYQALYNSNKLLPKIICNIRVGHFINPSRLSEAELDDYNKNTSDLLKSYLWVISCNERGYPEQLLNWNNPFFIFDDLGSGGFKDIYDKMLISNLQADVKNNTVNLYQKSHP